MKRRFSVAFAVFAASIMAISLVGCSNNDDTAQCEHDWIAATCTQPEFCSKCGETRGEAAGHNYVYTTVDATCDDAGSKNGECSVCHDKTTVYLPQLSHKYVSAVNEGDCETDTVTTYTCELCKDAYSEVTKRHVGHDTVNVTWTFKSETQEEEECEYLVTETAKCNTCKKDIERTYHKHVAKWEIEDVEYSTCKDTGAVYYVCACHDERYAKTEVLPVTPAAHVWSVSEKSGITHECDVCHATKSEVVITGNSATLTAEQLAGENIAIKTDAVTLQPDASLAGKMADGVDIAATPVTKAELPEVGSELAEKLEDAPIYNFELKNNAGNAIDFDGGKMTITVPYELSNGEDPTTVAVLYIDADGNEQVVDAVYGNGSATFTVEHFSHYAVVRLTAAERCVLMGHNYKSTNFAPTCTEDGFTVKSCNRCGDFLREDGDKKLGHDYKATVVPATCTEKGYTLMACSRENCGDSYVTGYTAILAHDYVDTVVSPTCTAKGYTTHTCKNCGHSYRDSYTDIIAHNFVGNECTVCHKKNDAAADSNFYLNLINSLGSTTEGYFVEVGNAKFEIKVTYGGEGGKHVEISEGEIETYKLQIALDKDGYLVGSGEGRMSFSATSSEQEVGGTQKVLLAFKNKKLYISIYQTNIDEYGKTVYEENMVMSQDEAGLDQIKAYVEEYYTDEIKAAVSKLLNNQSEGNPLNAILAKVYESVFDKKETASGYALTLNYDKTAKLLAYVNEHNCQEVFDAVFGAGEFNSLMKFVKEVPEMKYSDFVNKLTSKAEKYGLTQSDVYGIINSIMTKISNGEQFDFAEFVKGYSTKTVPEMVELLSGGEMTAEQVAAMITEMADAYEPALTDKDIPFVDFVSGMFAEGEMAEMVAEIKEFALSTLEALNEVAEKAVQVVLNTDASGVFASASVAVKDFAFDLELSYPLTPTDAKAEVTAEGTLSIVTGSGAIGDNNNIVVATENARNSFVNIMKNDKGSPIDYSETLKYQLIQYQGKYLLVPVLETGRYIPGGNLSDLRDEDYNGTSCKAADYVTWYSSYIIDLEADQYSCAKSCSGWTKNGASARYTQYTVYTLYFDNTYNLLGSELNVEATMEYVEDESYSKPIYTNAMQGKISLADPHKYTLIEEKKPTMCEETGYEKYRCTVCGEIKFYYNSLGHDYKTTYELKNAALGCEGGVIEVSKCTRCQKEITWEIENAIYEDGTHKIFYMEYPVEGAKCPDTHVIIQGCACGKYIDYIDVYGGCEFTRIDDSWCEWKDGNDYNCEHGYREHHTITYQCAVTACAYTYTMEERRSFSDSNCVVTDAIVFTLQDNTQFSMVLQHTQHADSTAKHTTEGDLNVETWYCRNCQQDVEIKKYDSYGRCVYEFDLVQRRGMETVFENGCYGYIYELNENGMREGEPIKEGIMHQTSRSVENKTSCTQAHQATWTCSVCHNVVDVDDYYYGHDFQYSDELEMPVCVDCGMTNTNYADGPVVLENLSKKTGGFKIGYTAYREILGISFYADYGTEDVASIESINYDQGYTGSYCGILTIDTDSVSTWLEQNAESTFTVVFETQARMGDKDEYPDYLEISITFTAEELAEILGIEFGA